MLALPLCTALLKVAWRVAYLDGFLIESKARILVGEELLDLKTLIALELDHLSHTLGFGVANDGAIASYQMVSHELAIMKKDGHQQRTEVLLDDLENLLMVKLARDALDSGQGLASITLCRRNVSNMSSELRQRVQRDTYAECVYGYTPGFAWFVRSRRRLRRRGLDIIKRVSGELLAGRRVQKRL